MPEVINQKDILTATANGDPSPTDASEETGGSPFTNGSARPVKTAAWVILMLVSFDITMMWSMTGGAYESNRFNSLAFTLSVMVGSIVAIPTILMLFAIDRLSRNLVFPASLLSYIVLVTLICAGFTYFLPTQFPAFSSVSPFAAAASVLVVRQLYIYSQRVLAEGEPLSKGFNMELVEGHLNELQRSILVALESLCAETGAAGMRFEVTGDPPDVLVAVSPRYSVWIYPDGEAVIGGNGVDRRFEIYDYVSVDEMNQAYLSTLRELLLVQHSPEPQPTVAIGKD